MDGRPSYGYGYPLKLRELPRKIVLQMFMADEWTRSLYVDFFGEVSKSYDLCHIWIYLGTSSLGEVNKRLPAFDS